MTETRRPTTEELKGVRKCPRHNAWVQSVRLGTGTDRYYHRYCPVCETEKAWEAAKQAEADRTAGIEKPKLIIRKY